MTENTNSIQTQNEFLSKKPQRNASFELLRIICMLLIISTHFLGHGDWKTNMTGANEVFGKLLQSIFYPSVNLYVMIGAYFMCQSTSTHVNWKKVLKLCGMVLFYSLLLYAISISFENYSFDTFWLLSSIFPNMSGKYWYLTAYLVLLVVSPFLNMIIRGLTTKQLFVGCVIITIIGGIQAEASEMLPQLEFSRGYSAPWFIGLYFITALIQRTDFKFNKKTAILAVILYLGTLVYGYFVHTKYASFMCVFSSVIIFVFFKELKIKNGWFAKVVCFISPLTFGVYLIHDSPEMRGFMYQNIFHSYKFYESDVAFLILIGFILTTFVVCAIFECGRKYLAKALAIPANNIIGTLQNKKQKRMQ
ncbi:MAG: acyltransferase [Clostridia bacterium]|nr:acyltransferase [Clostridia bacterium]